MLFRSTGGSDITLFEIDEAASRIKEEVDEDANIIFGSSFDESLGGKIRVSIVATGIGDNPQPRKIPVRPIIASSFEEETIAPVVPNAELDSNLEQFAAKKPVEEVQEEIRDEVVEELIEEAEIVAIPEDVSIENAAPALRVVEEPNLTNDYSTSYGDFLSSEEEEMPKPSSLFKAIITKNEELTLGSDLGDLLSNNNSFAPKTTIRQVEEELELFPNHNPHSFRKNEEAEELIINDEEEEYTPTLIERVTGFSIAKRNKKKQKEMERFQEPISSNFSNSANDYDASDRLNLEIPSFLRRK